MKHTQGIFRVEECSAGYLGDKSSMRDYLSIGVDVEGPIKGPSREIAVIGSVTLSSPITDEMRANAALFAAAPEMLEALEIARIILDPTEGSAFNGEGSANFLRIKNAIAKARGEK